MVQYGRWRIHKNICTLSLEEKKTPQWGRLIPSGKVAFFIIWLDQRRHKNHDLVKIFFAYFSKVLPHITKRMNTEKNCSVSHLKYVILSPFKNRNRRPKDQVWVNSCVTVYSINDKDFFQVRIICFLPLNQKYKLIDRTMRSTILSTWQSTGSFKWH